MNTPNSTLLNRKELRQAIQEEYRMKWQKILRRDFILIPEGRMRFFWDTIQTG